MRASAFQLRITMQEFVSGYKEGRDHSAEEIQAAMTTQVSKREGGREGGREGKRDGRQNATWKTYCVFCPPFPFVDTILQVPLLGGRVDSGDDRRVRVSPSSIPPSPPP
ncbi:hypothetical protein Naga_103298g1 [Nannochloropsis gaditana]|uniref:Uncharacterized protein n=1 Tax=Nannochloropsis gaditana TaxID=72520 RepID=W7U2I2_9STRA|nr:hypothetical protein Naga_103298g1 [Nannochloropsis gaditana]